MVMDWQLKFNEDVASKITFKETKINTE